MAKPTLSREFFRQTGQRGGLAQKRKYSKRQLSQWGRKGGRPKKKK